MSFRLLVGVLLVVFSTFGGTLRAQQPSQTATSQAHAYSLGTFVGTMPCADCPGITVKLILYAKGPNDLTQTTYRMELVYQGKKVKPFITNGNWTIVHGMPGSPAATIYQLDPDRPGHEQNFLRLSADALKQLDRDKQVVNSPYNVILKRVAGVP